MADGTAEIGFACRDGATRLAHLYERDPLRVLFPVPEPGDPPQAVLVTTSGGLVGGDRLDISVRLGAGTLVHLTAAAAEKIYRSSGPTATIRQRLCVAAGAALEFLPPETILFDGARLSRETVVELAPAAGFLGGDMVVFGRIARGERFTHGLLHAVWEVRRGGALVWGDAIHLDGDIAATIDDPACFDAAAAFATLILAPPGGDPQSLLADARAAQSRSAAPGLRGGITTVAGFMIARWLARDAPALRTAYAGLAAYLRQAVFGLPPRLPRLWEV